MFRRPNIRSHTALLFSESELPSRTPHRYLRRRNIIPTPNREVTFLQSTAGLALGEDLTLPQNSRQPSLDGVAATASIPKMSELDNTFARRQTPDMPTADGRLASAATRNLADFLQLGRELDPFFS